MMPLQTAINLKRILKILPHADISLAAEGQNKASSN